MAKVGNFKTWLIEGVRRRLRIDRDLPYLDDFSMPAEQARSAFGQPEGDLATIFFETMGRTVDKWLQYLPVYERHFERFRGKDFGMLEIGVFRGGSLELWRRYFGDRMRLFGIDINPACAELVDKPNEVRIGSQADPEFLKRVVDEMGSVEIVLDDGSHVAEHQRISFETLFPLLADGGLYVIEDISTSYWRKNFDGGYRRPGTAIEMAKSVIDDMHHWYHGRNFVSAARDQVAGVHFYDSIVVIEKSASEKPIRTRVGPNAEEDVYM
jgi:hypothetical protein